MSTLALVSVMFMIPIRREHGDYNDTGTSGAAGTALLVVDLIVDSLPPVNCFISHGSGIQRLYQLQAQKFTLLPGTGAHSLSPPT